MVLPHYTCCVLSPCTDSVKYILYIPCTSTSAYRKYSTLILTHGKLLWMMKIWFDLPSTPSAVIVTKSHQHYDTSTILPDRTCMQNASERDANEQHISPVMWPYLQIAGCNLMQLWYFFCCRDEEVYAVYTCNGNPDIPLPDSHSQSYTQIPYICLFQCYDYVLKEVHAASKLFDIYSKH